MLSFFHLTAISHSTFRYLDNTTLPSAGMTEDRNMNMIKQSKILYGGLRALGRELEKPEWDGARYTILLDENTFQHCMPLLVSSVEALQEAEFIEVPAGEECKSLEVAAQVWQTLLEGGADRSHVLVCLGGGSVCDLGGFVAAGYKRGIRHVNVPTTLLAMVDASIGGKTAIDFGGVKNSIGHFYPSVLTCIEHVFCNTLQPEQTLCGMMEMVKTAAVTDPELYARLTSSTEFPMSAINEVARIKTRVVKADPYDHGIRRILNLGHTFGHAFELSPATAMPHGLAVGLGMLVAMYLSVHKTGLDGSIYKSYSQWFRQLVPVPALTLRNIEPMLVSMHQDKKCADGQLLCVMLQDIGAAVIDVAVSDNEVRDALLHVCRPRVEC